MNSCFVLLVALFSVSLPEKINKVFPKNEVSSSSLIIVDNKVQFELASKFCKDNFNGDLYNSKDQKYLRELRNKFERRKVCKSEDVENCEYFFVNFQPPYCFAFLRTASLSVVKLEEVSCSRPAKFICLAEGVFDCTKKGHDCHGDANCYESKGSIVCICKSGFRGNGTVCDSTESDKIKVIGAQVFLFSTFFGAILLVSVLESYRQNRKKMQPNQVVIQTQTIETVPQTTYNNDSNL